MLSVSSLICSNTVSLPKNRICLDVAHIFISIVIIVVVVVVIVIDFIYEMNFTNS